jgi:hypothetical protein
MRSTFTQLQTKCLNITQNAGSTDSTLSAYIKDEINLATRFIYAELQDYMTIRSQTTSTVVAQQYYHMPPDVMNINTVVATIGSYKHVLYVIDSQTKWDKYNAVTFQPTVIPRFFFPRRDDFGIWPIPQSVYTLTVNYAYRIKDMTAEDYTTGTVTVSQNSTSVAGSGTTWTTAMEERWFKATNEGYFYRVSDVTGNTALTLESYFEGLDVSGGTYLIGESPEIPPELHVFIPYRVASQYFSGFRKDALMAQYWNNMFWTEDGQNNSRGIDEAHGGLLGAKKRYSKRSISRVVKKSPNISAFTDRIWATTIS